MKRSKAFTLLEVLLVLIVVVIAFFPLIQTLASGLLAGEEMKNTNTAILIAQKKIEELKNGSYGAISTEALATVEGYSAFERQVTVTTPLVKLKNVLVTLTWKVGGYSEIASVETMVTDI